MLNSLPEGVIFPDDLQRRIRFDAQQRRLAFSGFMTKCSYDELIALSSNLEYRRALEQLFVLSSKEIGSRPASNCFLRFVLSFLGLVLFAAMMAWMAYRTFSESEGGVADVQRIQSVESK